MMNNEDVRTIYDEDIKYLEEQLAGVTGVLTILLIHLQKSRAIDPGDLGQDIRSAVDAGLCEGDETREMMLNFVSFLKSRTPPGPGFPAPVDPSPFDGMIPWDGS